MALAAMCLEEGVEIEVAHVNYHTRNESDDEEKTVRLFCANHGIVCHVMNDAFDAQGNFEAAARSHRYRFFARIVQERNLQGVLVAHHQDDLIETFLMQSEKGIEPDWFGLRTDGMVGALRVKRPLLALRKGQLEEYCLTHGIKYHVDATNLEDCHARNRLRHHVVEPMGDFERNMVLREIDRLNAEKQERVCRVKAYIGQGRIDLSLYKRLAWQDRLTLLRQLESNGRQTSGKLHEVDKILMEKKDFFISFDGRRLVQENGKMFVIDEPLPYSFCYRSLGEIFEKGDQEWFQVAPGEPSVNAVTLRQEDFPMTIRSAREADKILMRFGTKPVHRFFIDRHVPLWKRKTWPVVVDRQGNVVLVSGLGCDINHFSIKPNLNVIQYSLM